MSKAWVRLATVAIICGVLGFSVGLYLSNPFSFEDLEYTWTAENLFNEVLERIGDVRGLAPSSDTKLQVVTLGWVEENWGACHNVEEIQVMEKIYKALFIIPENVDLLEVKSRQTGCTVAAASENKVYVVKEYFNPHERGKAIGILAHELTHVIQGTHFENSEPYSHDGKQAWSALIEGDAGLTAKKYLEQTGITPEDFQDFTGYDPLTKLWLFPYQYGESFVRELFEAGGWNEVNHAYLNPPETAEQIMHPEKYLKGERYVEVRVQPLNESSWNLVKTDRLGEHFILVMLQAHLPKGEALKSAEGWNGDNLTYYENKEGYNLFWKILWDTEEDASEFSNSVNNLMLEVGAEKLKPNLWKTKSQQIKLETEAEETLIIISQIDSNNFISELKNSQKKEAGNAPYNVAS